MKHHRSFLSIILIALSIAFLAGDFLIVDAEPANAWWDDEWPYRVAVQVSEPGPASVHLDFSELFSALGLADAVLDIRSIRIVPVVAGEPGSPVPYEETYSLSLYDAETLVTSPAPSEPYWDSTLEVSLSLNAQDSTEGSQALQVDLDYFADIGSIPNATYVFNGHPTADWSQYETLIYDLRAEVNDSALDQAPDLYQFELLGLDNCEVSSISGPALVLNQWNPATVSLIPFGACAEPDKSSLTGMRFIFPSGLVPGEANAYAAGDQVRLLLDGFRLVDQDGAGELRWMAEEGVDAYNIYFDTINHAGHDSPERAALTGVPAQAEISGPPEAGGVFHQIEGAARAGLTLWTAPTTEKILKTQNAPVTQSPLALQAAKGEAEALQIVVQSPTEQSLPVSVSNLTSEGGVIPAAAIQTYRVDYVTLTRLSDEYGRLTDWPDPLYPLLPGESVTFPAGVNQPLWFRVSVPADTPAGDYQGTITIGPATLPLTLTVWDFSLPEEMILPFAAGLNLNTLLEIYGGTLEGAPQPCYDELVTSIYDALAAYHITALPSGAAPSPGLVYSLAAYPQQEAQTAKAASGTPIWWQFTAQDTPPFPNPAALDRTGQEAQILPWMAWLDQVDGLYYQQLVDWEDDPWDTPFANYLSNGDGYLFYPPNDPGIGYDPCSPESNRLIPSIRLELLREGLEDYARLHLLGDPSAAGDKAGPSDLLAEQVVQSRTLYRHSPAQIASTRTLLAEEILAKGMDLYIPFFTR